MNEATIVINNKTFMLDFGMEVFKYFGEKFGEKSLMGTQVKMLEAFKGVGKDITFDQLDLISELVMCSLVPVNETDTLTLRELNKLYLTDTKKMLEIVTTIMGEFAKSVKSESTTEAPGKALRPAKAKSRSVGTNSRR